MGTSWARVANGQQVKREFVHNLHSNYGFIDEIVLSYSRTNDPRPSFTNNGQAWVAWGGWPTRYTLVLAAHLTRTA